MGQFLRERTSALLHTVRPPCQRGDPPALPDPIRRINLADQTVYPSSFKMHDEALPLHPPFPGLSLTSRPSPQCVGGSGLRGWVAPPSAPPPPPWGAKSQNFGDTGSSLAESFRIETAASSDSDSSNMEERGNHPKPLQ